MAGTSSGSPSSALVEGMKPQSYGKVRPAIRGFESVKIRSLGSYSNLARLPRGVSMIAWT
jgi:hypothetical protein